MIEFYRRTGFLTTTAALNIQIEGIQEIKCERFPSGRLAGRNVEHHLFVAPLTLLAAWMIDRCSALVWQSTLLHHATLPLVVFRLTFSACSAMMLSKLLGGSLPSLLPRRLAAGPDRSGTSRATGERG